jgi:DNA invertase Pin-like site-specific DNA recombinase
VRQLDGIAVDRVFTDKVSGKSADRPELVKLIGTCTDVSDDSGFARAGDTITVHSMDRLGRNVEDLRRIVRCLTGRGVRVEFVKEGLTFTGDDSAMNTLLLTMLGAVAEFERSLILERQREGIAIAKTNGTYKGRKPSLTDDQAAELRERAAAGESKASLARAFDVSRETVYSYLRAGDTNA